MLALSVEVVVPRQVGWSCKSATRQTQNEKRAQKPGWPVAFPELLRLVSEIVALWFCVPSCFMPVHPLIVDATGPVGLLLLLGRCNVSVMNNDGSGPGQLEDTKEVDDNKGKEVKPGKILLVGSRRKRTPCSQVEMSKTSAAEEDGCRTGLVDQAEDLDIIANPVVLGAFYSRLGPLLPWPKRMGDLAMKLRTTPRSRTHSREENVFEIGSLKVCLRPHIAGVCFIWPLDRRRDTGFCWSRRLM